MLRNCRDNCNLTTFLLFAYEHNHEPFSTSDDCQSSHQSLQSLLDIPFMRYCMYLFIDKFCSVSIFCAKSDECDFLQSHRSQVSVLWCTCSYRSHATILCFTGTRMHCGQSSSNLKWVQKQVLYFWTAESVYVVSGYWLDLWLKCTATIFRWCSIDWCLRESQRTGIWFFKSTLKSLHFLRFLSFSGREPP